MLKLFRISGDSLYPDYKDGQRVLCLKVYRKKSLHINDTVVFFKKNYGKMIKKILCIEKEQYFVQGTNPFSVDSRDFGAIDYTEIEYKVLFGF